VPNAGRRGGAPPAWRAAAPPRGSSPCRPPPARRAERAHRGRPRWAGCAGRLAAQDHVARFLVEAKDLVDAEPGTLTWFAFRVGPTSFGIFDAFDTEDARQTHLDGKVREAIEQRAEELFSTPPTITPVDLLAAKLPR
jgi:quinol monooxygenase YgiN